MDDSNILIYGWQTFSIQDLFTVASASTKFTKKYLSTEGSVPVYSSETLNGGISGYCNGKPTFIVDNDNPMYVIFGDHTKSMHIATESFCTQDNVKVLIPKYKDVCVLLYIFSVWKKVIPDLGYARHWNVAKDVYIPLPINYCGEINISYIKKHMERLKNITNNKMQLLNNI